MRTIILALVLSACTTAVDSTDGDDTISLQSAAERWALALCTRMHECLTTVPDIGACIEAITPQLLTTCTADANGYETCALVDARKPYPGTETQLETCLADFDAQGVCPSDADATGRLGSHPGCWE